MNQSFDNNRNLYTCIDKFSQKIQGKFRFKFNLIRLKTY